MATTYFEHHTIQGERWDLLAYRYYGDQHKQTVLIDANRALFVDQGEATPRVVVPPMMLPSGLVLKIPVIEDVEVDETGLPPWKRSEPVY